MVSELISGTAGFIGGVATWAIQQWWTAPRLFVQGPVEAESRGPVSFCTLSVGNRGRTAALSCIAALRDLDVGVEDLVDNAVLQASEWRNATMNRSWFRPIGGGSMALLPWATEERASANINPSLNQGVEICLCDNRRGWLIFPSERGRAQPRLVAALRAYCGTVVISGQNTKALEIPFTLEPQPGGVRFVPRTAT